MEAKNTAEPVSLSPIKVKSSLDHPSSDEIRPHVCIHILMHMYIGWPSPFLEFQRKNSSKIACSQLNLLEQLPLSFCTYHIFVLPCLFILERHVLNTTITLSLIPQSYPVLNTYRHYQRNTSYKTKLV